VITALSTDFDSIHPREIAGANSSDRSQYQKDWALCKILSLHLAGADYLVAFDIHDDVIVFEPEVAPQTVSFYQIKTKEGDAWRLGSLTNRKKGGDGKRLPSIIGKLYDDKIRFTKHTKRLSFVSNANFRLGPSTGKKVADLQKFETPFQELADKSKTKIKNALVTEYALSEAPELNDLLWFERSPMAIQQHDVFARGQLAQFLERNNPSGKYQVNLIYRTLFDEIKRRNDYSQPDIKYVDLAKVKGFGRSGFQQMLAIVCCEQSDTYTFNLGIQALAGEGLSFIDQMKMRASWDKITTKRADFSDLVFRQLVSAVVALSIVPQSSTTTTIDAACSQLKLSFANYFLYDDFFLRTLILIRIYKII
jgi:hypothetical protein